MHYILILTLLLLSHENFFSALQYRIVGKYRHVSGHTYDIRRTDYYYKYFTVFIPKKKSLISLRRIQYYYKYKRVPFWSTALPSFDILQNGKRSMRNFCMMNKERYILSQWTSSFERNFTLNKIHGTLKISC